MTPQQLARIHHTCFTTPRPWSESEFTALLQDPQVFLSTREQGFALGRRAGPEAELLTLAVHPQAQRRGLGRALLTIFENTAQRLDCTDLFLEVSAENHPAIQLYASAGYQEVGQRKNYYSTPDCRKITALVFRKS